jgi:polar amino acid transport system substrate-binding protein
LTGRLLAVILGLAVVAAGCSSGSAPAAGPGLPSSTSRPAAFASPLPAPTGVVVPGQLTIAADPTEAPLAYYDVNNRFAGFSIELVELIATQVGLTLNVINIDGPEIVPGLAVDQRRYDVGVAPQPATSELSSKASTLAYLMGGPVILVRHDDRQVIGPQSLCGLLVGGKRDRTGKTIVLRTNQGACLFKPIVYAPYDDDIKGIHDLQTGAIQAYLQDYAPAAALARLYGDIRILPRPLNPASEVFVFALANPGLRAAVSKAFDRVRHDGDYQRLLQRWGLQDGAIR